MEPYYRDRAPFLKHLHNLVVNGFWARELDADDHEFLEYVKVHGIANGSLPNTSAVLLEELEFWHLPYTVAPGVERRVGRRPRPVETSETAEMRQARSSAWHARRIIRENEKAIAEAELAREQREWKAAQQKRKLRELISDAEWEAAAPRRQEQFGATVDRHYVPRWKLDEIRQAKTEKKVRKILEASSPKLAMAERKARKAAQQSAEAEEAARLQALADKRARRAQERKQTQTQEQQRREQIIAEARETVDRVNRMEREWQGTYTPYTVETLTQAIITLLNSTPGHVWMGPDMARSLGCTDVELMNRCLDDMVRNGRLRKVGVP